MKVFAALLLPCLLVVAAALAKDLRGAAEETGKEGGLQQHRELWYRGGGVSRSPPAVPPPAVGPPPPGDRYAACGSATDPCMNELNLGECRALVDSGCQNLMVLESCPLQFECGDTDGDGEGEGGPDERDGEVASCPLPKPGRPWYVAALLFSNRHRMLHLCGLNLFRRLSFFLSFSPLFLEISTYIYAPVVCGTEMCEYPNLCVAEATDAYEEDDCERTDAGFPPPP